ncbi:MAG: hypothetical protein R3A49_12630 [Acidimicrobiia bacterium]
MEDPIGPLVEADESFDHPQVDTFGVGEPPSVPDARLSPSWTEKVVATAAARDGSLQLEFGMGRYPNRRVQDAFAGVSLGVQQWTVRASRRLGEEPHRTAVGPVRYDVVEPLREVRFRLEPSGVQPVAFDWRFRAEVPAHLEERERRRAHTPSQPDEDLVRYHQVGVADGWVELDGERHDIGAHSWFSSRDHSWGVRQGIGVPARGDGDVPPDLSVLVLWSPMLLERPGGARYGIHHYLRSYSMPGFERVHFQGAVEHADGSRTGFAGVEPDLRFDPVNRRLLGGTLGFTTSDGSARPIHIEAASDTGFHLGTGLYFGFDGHHHGEERGLLHVDGEHIADCSLPEVARRVHQLRDCVVTVDDPVGGGHGWGTVQSIVTGPHPAMGLDAGTSFV